MQGILNLSVFFFAPSTIPPTSVWSISLDSSSESKLLHPTDGAYARQNILRWLNDERIMHTKDISGRQTVHATCVTWIERQVRKGYYSTVSMSRQVLIRITERLHSTHWIEKIISRAITWSLSHLYLPDLTVHLVDVGENPQAVISGWATKRNSLISVIPNQIFSRRAWLNAGLASLVVQVMGIFNVIKIFPLPSGKANCKLPQESALRYHIAFWLHTILETIEHLLRIEQLTACNEQQYAGLT